MLLVLHPYKFNNHYFKEYELDIFEKKLSTNFEIHDLSKVVNPNWRKAFSGKVHKKAKVFNTLKDWEDYFLALTKKNRNITILNNLDMNTINSLIIHHILCKSKNNIIQYRSPSIPLVKRKKKIDLLYISLNIFNLEFLNFSKLFYFLKVKILAEISKLLKFEKVFILFSGSKKNFKLLLNSKKNIYVKIHSKDYSKFLLNIKINKNQNKKRQYAVFLDLPGPYFINDKKLFGLKIDYNIKKWYKDLNKYLTLLEQSFNLKVIIIPHPKARGIVNPFYDKKFKVIKDFEGAIKHIPKSQFVINIGGSAALGLAAVNKKPIMILYNNQIIKNDQYMFLHSKNMSKELGSSFVNINDDFKKNKLNLNINNQKYYTYKYNYLTSKQISKKMNYDIFNKIIAD